MNDQRINRRSFLMGAAGVVSGAAAALSPTRALARALKSSSPPAIAFWEEGHLTPASRVPAGAPLSGPARITLKGYLGKGAITAIDVNYSVAIQQGVQTVPFQAWTASSTGTGMARFTADVTQGLSLTIYQGKESFNVVLGGSLKLREGTYVITEGSVDLTSFRLDLKNKTAPMSHVLGLITPKPYILLQISSL